MLSHFFKNKNLCDNFCHFFFKNKGWCDGLGLMEICFIVNENKKDNYWKLSHINNLESVEIF